MRITACWPENNACVMATHDPACFLWLSRDSMTLEVAVAPMVSASCLGLLRSSEKSRRFGHPQVAPFHSIHGCHCIIYSIYRIIIASVKKCLDDVHEPQGLHSAAPQLAPSPETHIHHRAQPRPMTQLKIGAFCSQK